VEVEDRLVGVFPDDVDERRAGNGVGVERDPEFDVFGPSRRRLGEQDENIGRGDAGEVPPGVPGDRRRLPLPLGQLDARVLRPVDRHRVPALVQPAVDRADARLLQEAGGDVDLHPRPYPLAPRPSWVR
jgi:hypothetical protein